MKLSLCLILLLAGLQPLFAAVSAEQGITFADEEISSTSDVYTDDDEEEYTDEDELEKEKKEEIPAWLAELSNLPRAKREEYIAHFAKAKAALAQGNWVDCDAELTSCEFLFNKNPNIHNLRVACYIEQKRFADAEEEMEKARKLLPSDPTTLVNMAGLHMAKKDYAACISSMTEVLESPALNLTISQEVRDILVFRIFLCHLMRGELQQAEEWVSDLTPISDTPLFYYSRAAICLYLRDAAGARRDLQSASNIFGESGMLVPYQRALLSCDMSEAKR